MALANDFDTGLTWERLTEVLDIYPEEGRMIWRDAGPKKPHLKGAEAGVLNGHGYVVIGIDGRSYRRARLMWFFVYRNWPRQEIDHKNTTKSDDRISNLREASYSQNMFNRPRPKNNTSGHKGIDWRAKRSSFRARITVSGKTITLGHFKTLEEAIAARIAADPTHHGEFARSA